MKTSDYKKGFTSGIMWGQVITMIVTLLVLLLSKAHAQQCLPTDWDYPPELRGCPSILKVLRTQVTFPNKKETVVQVGTGSCGHLTDCNVLMYPFLGDKECWPKFLDPERGYGFWRRVVVSVGAVDAVVKYCTKDNFVYPLVGPQCQETGRERYVVESSCETAVSGQLPWFNPFYLDPVCSWTYLPGTVYCGDLEPVNK